MKRIFLGLMAVMLTACGASNRHYAPAPAFSLQVTAAQRNDCREEIFAQVAEAAEKYGAVGVQVAVMEKGEVTQCFAWGWATKDTAPMTPWHKIRVASLSKIPVGVAAHLLREEGTVVLEEQIGTYWGVNTQRPVTLQQILTHTSSLRAFGTATSRDYGAVLRRLQAGGFTDAQPGAMEDWYYNNYAFGVLGMTLELASGEPVDGILQRRLFAKMDIDAAFAGSDLQRKDLIATLYRSGGQVARTAQMQSTMTRDKTPGATGTYFAGGLLCSAYDFAKLLSLLANDGSYKGTKLLSAQSVALMESCAGKPSGQEFYQASPMRCREGLFGRQKIFYHTGSAYGVYHCASYDPETGDGVVVLTTGARGSKDSCGIYKICADISNYIYDLLK